MYKIADKKRFIIFATAVAALVAVSTTTLIFSPGKKDGVSPSAEVNQAGKVGEKVTNQLLVQIERPKGNPEDLSGRYERGDIVLIAHAEKEWSDAEKSGFLILKMDLTPAQAELLTKPLTENAERPAGSRPEAQQKTLKRRKFAVDLAKIGIGDEDEKGRVIEDKIFGAEIIIEK